mgnify:FL=1
MIDEKNMFKDPVISQIVEECLKGGKNAVSTPMSSY